MRAIETLWRGDACPHTYVSVSCFWVDDFSKREVRCWDCKKDLRFVQDLLDRLWTELLA